MEETEITQILRSTDKRQGGITMQVITANVTNMVNYLKHALEFEKFVHVWTESMDEVNKRMENIYRTRRQLECAKAEKAQGQAKLLHRDDRPQLQFQQEAARFDKKAKQSLRFLATGIILAAVLGVVIGLAVCTSTDTLAVPPAVAILLLALGCPLAFLPFLLLGCIPAYVFNKNKASQYREKAQQQGNQRSYERRILILAEEEKQIGYSLASLDEDETALSAQQEQILSNLKNAQQTLAQIYALNVLPAKYRNLCAVATFYEYLTTRRCDKIAGHGGIYDTYETERIQLEQLRQMVMMNERLSRIEDYQRRIYQELQQANESLSEIKSSLVDIQATHREIAKNTALIAESSAQTAAATNWLAYRAWQTVFNFQRNTI